MTFDSGETLLLPEEGADKAIGKFAALQGDRPLLGRGWLRFDMRDPSKLVARKPGTSIAHAVADPGDAPAGDTKTDAAKAGNITGAVAGGGIARGQGGLGHGKGRTGRAHHRAGHRIVQGVGDDRAEGATAGS